MTELAIAVDADDEMWTLDNLPTPEAPYVEVESELIEVRSRFPSSYYTLTGETLPPRIRVRRGIAGTTAASHIQGSTLTPNYGLGGGAGAGVTVDNQSDPPAEVTTLIAPGAVITGDEATLPVNTLSRSVTLTDAQIKTLPTTYVEIVPSPGAGQLIILMNALVVLDTTAGAYTGADADCYLELVYGDWDGDASVTTSKATTDDRFESASIKRLTIPAYMLLDGADLIGNDVFIGVNLPLKLAMFNTSGNMGGGNAANTLKVTAWYGIVDAS